MMMEAVASRADDDDPGDPGGDAGKRLTIAELVKPADWPEGKN